jgi:hypothetical protein
MGRRRLMLMVMLMVAVVTSGVPGWPPGGRRNGRMAAGGAELPAGREGGYRHSRIPAVAGDNAGADSCQWHKADSKDGGEDLSRGIRQAAFDGIRLPRRLIHFGRDVDLPATIFISDPVAGVAYTLYLPKARRSV